jgi:hypothetical protein
MTRALLFVLTVHLLACGGSTPGAAKPGDGAAKPGEDAVGDAVAATPSDEAPTTSGRKTRDSGEFAINQTDASSRPTNAKLKATDTEAAVRFFVVDKDKGPITGIVISLTAPTGEKYYTEETDADGFAEVLVPIGKTYDLIYLSLGRRNVASQVTVASEPRLNLKLTMRYKREDPPPPIVAIAPIAAPTGAETSRRRPRRRRRRRGSCSRACSSTPARRPSPAARHARLDTIVEYMTHKKSAKHRDLGPHRQRRRCQEGQQEAVPGSGPTRSGPTWSRRASTPAASRRSATATSSPIASNDTPAGRQQNRRIEAMEAM